jgi:hypothetical protein
MTIQTETKPRAPIERTEHPHIVKSADTLGGGPRIEETRISVLLIFDMFEGVRRSTKSRPPIPTSRLPRSTMRSATATTIRTRCTSTANGTSSGIS